MKHSNISWTDHTFSPWRGCQKVSPACTHCYADAFSVRNPKTLGVFGTESQGGTRVVAAEAYWKQPLKWSREAVYTEIDHNDESNLGKDLGPYNRPRVFCASIADVFEDWSGPMMNHKGERLYHFENDWIGFHPEAIVALDPVTMTDVRQRLFRLIEQTPNLDWLLLTKRPENILSMWPRMGFPDIGVPGTLGRRLMLENTWLGTTVENQEYADKRILELLKCRELSPVLFLSGEPLLGPVDLRPKAPDTYGMLGMYKKEFDSSRSKPSQDRVLNCFPEIDWVIVGCESGPHRRETKLEWVRDLRDQCAAAGVAFFVKQLEIGGKVTTDISQFPEDLQIQEFPEVVHQ